MCFSVPSASLLVSVYNHIQYFNILLVGYSSVLARESQAQKDQSPLWLTLLGLGLLVIALVIQGFYLVFEEMILKKYEISPLRWAGTAGFFAMIHMFNYMIIFSFVDCPSPELCTMGDSFEDPYTAITDLWGNNKVMFWCGAMVVSIAFYNFATLSLS